MTTTESKTYEIKLPNKHFWDWHGRDLADLDGFEVEIIRSTALFTWVRFNKPALEELLSDSWYYALEMDPTNTGDIDYRPAARRCIAWIEKAGVKYTRHGSSVYLD